VLVERVSKLLASCRLVNHRVTDVALVNVESDIAAGLASSWMTGRAECTRKTHPAALRGGGWVAP
jgi:hypothetical protein